jgi:ribonuclease HI
MNNRYKRAGKSTYEIAEQRHRSRLWLTVACLGVIFAILIIASNSTALGIGGVGFLGLIILARVLTEVGSKRTRTMYKEERQAIRGAIAEEKIGDMLRELGEDYLVLHDIACPYGNIDHVVISKANGVFLLETKSHGGEVTVEDGQLLVNGHPPEKDFIKQALRNAYWFRDGISNAIDVKAWVQPVLVFTNAFVGRIPPLKGVTIVNKKYLLNVLKRPHRNVLASAVWEGREKIVEVLYGPALETPVAEGCVVCATCEGASGKLEYRGVQCGTGEQLFHQGPFEGGTRDVGEFLAIVHALALFKRKQIGAPVYSASQVALDWVASGKCRTDLQGQAGNAKLFGLVVRAEKWLSENDYENRVRRWYPGAWGEITAGIGRKYGNLTS